MAKRVQKNGVWNNKLRRASGSLFERLLADEEDIPPPTDLDEVKADIGSIKRHLRLLLNTSEGSASSAPGLGVSDFDSGHFETNDVTKHIAASIRKCVEQYEPRIENVTVQHVSDPDRPLQMNYKIVGMVKVGSGEEQVQIDLLMDDRKSCRVE